MLGNITLNEISLEIVFLVGLTGGITYLHKSLKSWLEKLLDEKFKAISTKITDLETKVDKMDLEACQNFLVRFLADVERGDNIVEVEKKRFWDEYEYYISNGGNSYIKEWVEKLKKRGLL